MDEVSEGRGRAPGFVLRLGGMVVAPRQTLDAVLRGGPGGIRDLIGLLVLQVVAVQLPELVVALLIMVRQSYSSGMTLLVNTVAASSWMSLGAAIVGAVLIGPLTRGYAGRERSLDVTALCALPPIALQLLASLLMAVLRLDPHRWLAISVLSASGAWFLILLREGVRGIRATPAEPRR